MVLKHIVLIRSLEKDLLLREAQLINLRKKLLGMESQIAEIAKMEVGKNISPRVNAYDIALNMQFLNEDDLLTYSMHPIHITVLNFMKTIPLESVVVDYWQ